MRARAAGLLLAGDTELDDNDREISRAIGSLEATVKHLTKTWERQDTEATEGRRRLYEKVEELARVIGHLASRSDMDHLEGRFNELSGRVGGIEAKVSAHELQSNNREQQLIGSKKVIAVVWSAILVITSMAGGIVVKLVEIFWPPKH